MLLHHTMTAAVTHARVGTFYIFLLKLFDRVFGEESTGFRDESLPATDTQAPRNPYLIKQPSSAGSARTDLLLPTNQAGPSSAATSSKWQRGKRGGWLGSAESSMTRSSAKLVELLSPRSRMVERFLLARFDSRLPPARKAFEMNLSALPRRMQLKFLNDPMNDCTSVSVSCFRYEAAMQVVKSPSRPLETLSASPSYVVFMDPLEYFVACLLKYPLTVLDKSSVTADSAGGRKTSGLASIKAFYERGVAHWASAHTYFSLLNAYMHLFLSPGGAGLAGPASGGELFLALAVDLWLDNSNVVKRSVAFAESLKVKSGSGLQLFGAADPSPSPLEVLLADPSLPEAWTLLSLQSVYLLLALLLRDSALLDQLAALHHNLAASKVSLVRSSSASSPGAMKVAAHPSPAVLPPALLVVQAPLFDSLRIIFSKADIINPCKSYAAFEAWLLYIQPWKVASDSQTYTPRWRPFVVANFHFYSTLLALYLRCTARMDISSARNSKSNEVVLLELLERVLSVFSSDLADLVDLILTSVYNRLRSRPATTTPAKPSAAEEALSEEELEVAVTHHFDMFPDPTIVDCADAGLVSIRYHAKDACKVIAESLWVHPESPSNQGVLAFLLGSGVGDASAAKVAKTASNVIRMLTEVLCVVELNSLVVRSRSAKRSVFGEIVDGKIHAESHSLTQEEKDSILKGKLKSSKYCVAYRGDQMDRPLTSKEWRLIARALISLSKHLNSRLNLPLDDSSRTRTWIDVYFRCIADVGSALSVLRSTFRLNLRVLADVRVVFCLFLATSLLLLRWALIGPWTSLLATIAFLWISVLKLNSFFYLR